MKQKKVFALLIALSLLYAAAIADVPATLNQRMATRSGPGTRYTEELGTLPSSTQISVISKVETHGTIWCQVEFWGRDGRLYRAYTGRKRIDCNESIPWEREAYADAYLTASSVVYYGPGYHYASRSGILDRGTEVALYDYENGFGWIEYQQSGQWIRGYVPGENVSTWRETEWEYEAPDEPWQESGWQEPQPGISGWSNGGYDGGGQAPAGNSYHQNSGYSRDLYAPYEIGVPELYGQVYRKDDMNLVIYWVQVQMKATGVYYQGGQWDETGSLGSHTMQEIASFMQARGYRGHGGYVDQQVVNELADYLGSRRRPVYAGGFYEFMNSIMDGGSAGSMTKIVSNLRDMTPRVTLGARWVQACLAKLGYYTGAIDGKYGEGTDRAVKAFQRANGFQERDYVTLGVARAMLEACYYNGFDVTDLP